MRAQGDQGPQSENIGDSYCWFTVQTGHSNVSQLERQVQAEKDAQAIDTNYLQTLESHVSRQGAEIRVCRQNETTAQDRFNIAWTHMCFWQKDYVMKDIANKYAARTAAQCLAAGTILDPVTSDERFRGRLSCFRERLSDSVDSESD